MAIATLLLLTGCASAAEPPKPLSQDEAIAQWERVKRSAWAEAATSVPGALLPDIDVVAVVDSEEFPFVFGECLVTASVSATAGDSRYAAPDADPQAVVSAGTDELAQLACAARYPDQDALEAFLSKEQAAALFDYYARFSVPCLRSIGFSSWPDLVGRRDFIEATTAGPWPETAWSPYRTVDGTADPAAADLAERLCPPTPAWLDDRVAG